MISNRYTIKTIDEESNNVVVFIILSYKFSQN
jgi:hypothetical protein